jgi:23S rRNA-/tRNA-specific pseudouridylate synthase
MEQQSQETWVWVPFEVDKKFDGWRIDQFLTERLTGYSRSKVQKILTDARVHKDGKPAKINSRVKTSDRIEVAYLRKPEKPLAPEAALEILFEDEHLVIINKPANLLSHPTDKIVHNTVLGVLRQSRSDIKSLHLLHRLIVRPRVSWPWEKPRPPRAVGRGPWISTSFKKNI